MLRYKTETRPGLVALYDIRPGNGAGPFLQPWSPHGASDFHQYSVSAHHCSTNRLCPLPNGCRSNVRCLATAEKSYSFIKLEPLAGKRRLPDANEKWRDATELKPVRMYM